MIDTAIMVCAQAAASCPRIAPPPAEVLHWELDDPSRVDGPEDVRLAAFRRTRDEIAARLRAWLRTD